MKDKRNKVWGDLKMDFVRMDRVANAGRLWRLKIALLFFQLRCALFMLADEVGRRPEETGRDDEWQEWQARHERKDAKQT